MKLKGLGVLDGNNWKKTSLNLKYNYIRIYWV